MNEYTFQDDAGNEFQFSGDLIVERSDAIKIDEGFERSVTVGVYGVESGGFVPVLKYETNSPNENSVSRFEVVDALKDVECFFYVFEADEVFVGSDRLSTSELDEQTGLGRAISSTVEKLVFDLLDDLESVVESKGFVDKPVDEKKKSLWGLLG